MSGFISLPISSSGGSGITKIAMSGSDVNLVVDAKTALSGLVVPLDVGRFRLGFVLSLKNTPYWTNLQWTGANSACIAIPTLVNPLTGPSSVSPASDFFATQIDSNMGDIVFQATLAFDITVTTAGDYTLYLTKKSGTNGVCYADYSYATVEQITF